MRDADKTWVKHNDVDVVSVDVMSEGLRLSSNWRDSKQRVVEKRFFGKLSGLCRFGLVDQLSEIQAPSELHGQMPACHLNQNLRKKDALIDRPAFEAEFLSAIPTRQCKQFSPTQEAAVAALQVEIT